MTCSQQEFPPRVSVGWEGDFYVCHASNPRNSRLLLLTIIDALHSGNICVTESVADAFGGRDCPPCRSSCICRELTEAKGRPSISRRTVMTTGKHEHTHEHSHEHEHDHEHSHKHDGQEHSHLHHHQHEHEHSFEHSHDHSHADARSGHDHHHEPEARKVHDHEHRDHDKEPHSHEHS